jgi:Na+/H+ antiporter NhaD/arsenite permease-like protein
VLSPCESSLNTHQAGARRCAGVGSLHKLWCLPGRRHPDGPQSVGAGRGNGPFSGVLALMTDAAGNPRNAAYFWVTGMLSAVLDNVPTYLVFFGLAGHDADRLMGDLAPTLTAISMGAVYMGALTYIGNAPNFMIYAIATERGVKMPGFFGYMAWSAVVLLPVFAVVTYVFLVR